MLPYVQVLPTCRLGAPGGVRHSPLPCAGCCMGAPALLTCCGLCCWSQVQIRAQGLSRSCGWTCGPLCPRWGSWAVLQALWWRVPMTWPCWWVAGSGAMHCIHSPRPCRCTAATLALSRSHAGGLQGAESCRVLPLQYCSCRSSCLPGRGHTHNAPCPQPPYALSIPSPNPPTSVTTSCCCCTTATFIHAHAHTRSQLTPAACVCSSFRCYSTAAALTCLPPPLPAYYRTYLRMYYLLCTLTLPLHSCSAPGLRKRLLRVRPLQHPVRRLARGSPQQLQPGGGV